MPITQHGANASVHVYGDYNDYGTQNVVTQITNSGMYAESSHRYLMTSDTLVYVDHSGCFSS